jgi:hypothetical protein
MDNEARPQAEAHELVIQGLTQAGERFRPSDWAERLCGMMSVFGEDRHLSYSPYLKPVMAEGLSCVVVDRALERIDPAAFKFLLGFANDNELRMRPGRGGPSGERGPESAERRVPEPAREREP